MKHLDNVSFNQTFIDKVIAFAAANDCEICTSLIQSKNGTIQLYDSNADVYYTLHANGYVRRKYKVGGDYGTYVNYQLNRKTMTKNAISDFAYNSINRVLALPEEQLEILKRVVPLFRTHDYVQRGEHLEQRRYGYHRYSF